MTLRLRQLSARLCTCFAILVLGQCGEGTFKLGDLLSLHLLSWLLLKKSHASDRLVQPCRGGEPSKTISISSYQTPTWTDATCVLGGSLDAKHRNTDTPTPAARPGTYTAATLGMGSR